MLNDEKFAKIKTLAHESGIPEGSLYGEVASGSLPHVRIGSRGIFIAKEEFFQWLQSKRRTGINASKKEYQGAKPAGVGDADGLTRIGSTISKGVK